MATIGRYVLPIKSPFALFLLFLTTSLKADYTVLVHDNSYVSVHNYSDVSDELKEYNDKLLIMSLEATEDEFGKVDIVKTPLKMSRDRQFIELIKGKNLNVMVSPPKKDWHGKVIRVPFPIQKGFSSYRIFLIRKDNQNMFKSVDSLATLKLIPTGSNEQWSTTRILRQNNFNVITGSNYYGIFSMLNNGRFHSFNRGINEIFVELDLFAEEFPNLTYDKHIVLYTYLPSYFYVSPGLQELATRIEKGLIKLHHSGQIDPLFNQYFGQYLEKINLKNRRMFFVENTNLSEGMYEHDLAYLLDIARLPN